MQVHDLHTLKQAVAGNLRDNILGYWLQYAPDEQHGGFVGQVDADNCVNPGAEKSVILNTRILWTFSAAYLLEQNTRYLQFADRAYYYITGHFRDNTFGGVYWTLQPDGTPANRRKQVYAQAFAIYALTEYYKINKNETVLDWAKEIFTLLEKHSRDRALGGYLEAFAEDWSGMDDVRLSEKDMNEKKTMNTHLHVLEAYTNLYRVWPTEEVAEALGQLCETFFMHFVNAKHHLNLFFDEQWNLKSHTISYGHDIECSWLLCEAAEVLQHKGYLHNANEEAVDMALAVLNEGTDSNGGIFNEFDQLKLHLDTDKDWWPQAEGLVGFYNAYSLSGNPLFLETVYKLWNFIDHHVADHANGEWHWRVDRHGKPYREEKIGPWKCPYHNARACIELLRRIK